MPVRIGRGSKTRWRSGDLLFRIESKADRATLETAFGAAARELIGEEDDEDYVVKNVSDPVVLPDGIAFWLDAPDPWPALVDKILAVIVAALESAGIDCRLSCPPLLARFEGPWIVVVAVPSHPGARGAVPILPAPDVERCLAWVLDDAGDTVSVSAGAADIALPRTSARDLVHYWLAAGRSVTVTADVDGDQRVCSLRHPATTVERYHHGFPHIGIAIGGRSVVDDLDSAFDGMLDRARDFGDGFAWLYATVEAGYLYLDPCPYWPHEPDGLDATTVLTDHVLDAYAWQRLRPAQAARLPAELPRLASFDASTGELGLASLDHWLRAAYERDDRGIRATIRSEIAPIVATRSVTWERVQALPAALPRPADEPEYVPPVVDANGVPLVGATAHPSLGVSPVELLALRRGLTVDDPRLDVSPAVRHWLDRLGSVAHVHEPWLRRIVFSVADIDVSEEWGNPHRRVLVDWLVRTLIPRAAEAAGMTDLSAVAQLPPLTEAFEPFGVIAVLLGCLRTTRRDLHDTARDEGPSDEVARTLMRLADPAARAATTRRRWKTGYALVYDHVARWSQTEEGVGDRMARNVYWRGALPEGAYAFDDAARRAAIVFPRRVHAWLDPQRPIPLDARFHRGAAYALIQWREVESAWDHVVAAGREALPGYWEGLVAILGARLDTGEVEQALAASRTTLDRIIGAAQNAGHYAAIAAIAALLCAEVASTSVESGRSAEVAGAALASVDDLVARLAAAADPA